MNQDDLAESSMLSFVYAPGLPSEDLQGRQERPGEGQGNKDAFARGGTERGAKEDS